MRTRILLVLVLMLAAAAPSAAERTLVIESFTATVSVGTDGAIDVAETIRPRFTGSWNGIFRTIPVTYTTPQGFKYELRLEVQSITDDAGRELKFESSRERHYRKLKIWVPGAQDATRTVVIRYRVTNGLKFFEDHDELYWNVTGDEWEVPIERAQAFITLPAAATGLRVATFTGGYGSQEAAARWRLNASTVAVETARVLSFREGLTVAVGWNPGVVRRPTAADRGAMLVRDNGILLLPVFVTAFMARLWWKKGRDPRRRPIAVQYEPPDQLTPAELGTLVDNKPDQRDITATVVDLAVRGFVRIREERTERFLGLGTKTDHELILLKPADAWSGLRDHETAMLRALFPSVARSGDEPAGSGEGISRVMVSDLQNKFYKNLPTIKNYLHGQLVTRGYYARRPDTVAAVYVGLAVAVLAVGGVLAGILNAGAAGWIAVVASAAAVGAFGALMPARTEAGARAQEGVLGFEEFLDRVEADRLERVVRTPEMFERYLPHAMALGVERNWARAFEGIYTQAPSWYVGSYQGGFGPRMFAASLADLSSDASSAMTSAPRSSGGSGFSGGSSGGGFGGGGGGGF